MDWFWTIAQIVLPLLVAVYFYYKHKFGYWSKRGINGPTPIPLVGNLWEHALKGQVATEHEWSKKYGKVYGFYVASEPFINITDHELIKQVMVKDFPSLVNRRGLRNPHEIWDRNLFNLFDDDWKRVRTITSPTFTSGKLRHMNALMNQSVDKLQQYFLNIIKSQGGIITTKEVVSGFTVDVIASTSFATDTNANDPNRASKANPVLVNAMNLTMFKPLRILLLTICPVKVLEYLQVPENFSPKCFNFFRDFLTQVLKERKAQIDSGKKIKRNDLVQLLIDARASEADIRDMNFHKLTATDDSEEPEEHEASSISEKPQSKIVRSLDDKEIIAQCILFFVAGFETTATTITYCLYELAQNPDIQDRLHEELQKGADLKVDSDAYFDAVNTKIPYLEAVIKETLRKYPPVLRLTRKVGVNGFKLGDLPLEKGQSISVTVHTVHHNPEYYPDPERFDPERFLPENKHLLVPYTYLPFGQGPRNCIGMRFAYQEIKLLLARLIPAFRLSPTATTPSKLTFVNLNLLSTAPFQLKVSKRV